MNPEEYAAQQAVISAAVARYVQSFSQFFAAPVITLAEWLRLLDLLFPEIQRRRDESAALGRRFYDAQRAIHYPDLPRNERPLEGTTFDVFVRNMEPARRRMSQADTPKDAVTEFALRAVREVENAGRQQIIHAVDNDPQTLRGWARVATGRETCAWCLMLISRGPTYVLPETAGIDLDEDHALELFQKNDLDTYFEDISEHMEQWHTGCDCKVIPVFKAQENWFGKQAADRALELWNDATREAIALEDEGLVHRAGKKKGQPFTRNELAINALRRRLDRGEINATEYAALAA